ncbi:hypothetical protein ACROYT_G006695 [Oculina patagonica]
MASIADIQWDSFCSNVVHEWSGCWTFWNADTRQVKDKFRMFRSFVALDEAKTIIKHQNRFQNEDGEEISRPGYEGPWEILKQDTDDQGFCHSAYKNARAVLHSNGGGVWTRKHVPGDQDVRPFGAEMFLSRGEFRCSVLVFYNESKQLRTVGTIREKKLNTQDEMWSSSTALQNGLNLSISDEDFIGFEKTLDKNLQLSIVSDCKWDKEFWTNGTKEVDAESDTLLFLPDNICLSCPSKLSSNSFSLRSCLLFPLGEQRELQELTVTFVDGCLHSVKQGLYHSL